MRGLARRQISVSVELLVFSCHRSRVHQRPMSLMKLIQPDTAVGLVRHYAEAVNTSPATHHLYGKTANLVRIEIWYASEHGSFNDDRRSKNATCVEEVQATRSS